MKSIIMILALTVSSMIFIACEKNKSEADAAEEKFESAGSNSEGIKYLTVEDVFNSASELIDKEVHVTGEIEHVCKHTWKRFKIVGDSHKHELKVELGDKFEQVDPSIKGRKVNVTGKLKSVQMNAQDVKQWEAKMKKNHKGEEDTEHYKEELANIQAIAAKIEAGEIPYYNSYYLEAKKYDLR